MYATLRGSEHTATVCPCLCHHARPVIFYFDGFEDISPNELFFWGVFFFFFFTSTAMRISRQAILSLGEIFRLHPTASGLSGREPSMPSVTGLSYTEKHREL